MAGRKFFLLYFDFLIFSLILSWPKISVGLRFHLRKIYLCKFLIARFTFPNEPWIIDSFLNNGIRNFRIVTSLMKSFVTFVTFYQLVLRKKSVFIYFIILYFHSYFLVFHRIYRVRLFMIGMVTNMFKGRMLSGKFSKRGFLIQ